MALVDNLIAFWKLEEASGSRIDSVGSNNLTDNNTVTQATGIVGNAAQFARANSEHLSILDNIDLSTGDIDFSFACWIYLDSKTNSSSILGKWTGLADQREYLLIYLGGATDRFHFVVSGDGNGTQSKNINADTFGAVPTGVWIFVVFWHDATANTVNISVNNGAVDSAAHTFGVFDGTGDFNIGATEAAFDFMDGRIDAVGFWKKVLSAAERTELYNNGNGLEYPFAAPSPPFQSRISIAQP